MLDRRFPNNRERDALLGSHGEHVFDEIVAILARHQHLDIHAIEDLRGRFEAADHEFSGLEAGGRDDGQLPGKRRREAERARAEVTALAILEGLHFAPVQTVDDYAVSQDEGLLGLGDRQQQDVEHLLVVDGKGR